MGNKCCPCLKNNSARESPHGSSTSKDTSLSHRKVKIESNNLSEHKKGSPENSHFNPFKKKPPHVMRDNYKLLLNKDKNEENIDMSLATTSLLHINNAIIKNNQ